jgi:glycosyltransferase involved in cell wall biosynthesis
VLNSELISILIPLYNEEELIEELLRRVVAAPLPEGFQREIVVVDDCSADDSYARVLHFSAAHAGLIDLQKHKQNLGKGAAIRTALRSARGVFCIIQDADLEYDPNDYAKLFQPLIEGRADAVYGSRFAVSGERRVLYFWHSIGNLVLTTACNMASDLNLSDIETCYKAFRTSLVQSIPLRSERFGMEPEITIKLAQRGARVYELPISYHGRTYEEGKKIGLLDGFEALWTILRFWWKKDIYGEGGPDILDVLSDAKHFNRWMADTLRPHVGNRIMEIGAGIGNISVLLCRHRELYIATDIDREHLARLSVRLAHRPQVRVQYCNLEEPDGFANHQNDLDTAICVNVLEHVANDAAGLRHIHSVLRPGGQAIILVPQDMKVFGTLDEVLQHCRRYSKEELRDKMQQAGFTVTHMIEFNRVTRPGWIWNGRILKRRYFSRFQIGTFDRFVWLWKRLDHYMPWPGTSLIAVGVRQ